MKTTLLLLLLSSICLAQPKLHHFEISNDIIWYEVDGDTIIHDYKEMTFSSNTSFMDQDQLIINEEVYTYDGNKITLDGTTFQFKRPWFSNKTSLVNLDTAETLLQFRTSHKNSNAYEKNMDQNWESVNENSRKVLLEWAHNKQAEYALYNYNRSSCDSDDFDDAIMWGIIAGSNQK